MTRLLSGNFIRNHRVAGRVTTSLQNILNQYETVQYAMVYLLQTSENRLKVHKMAVNKKRH